MPRGIEFIYGTVRDWEKRFAGIFAKELRAKRQGKVGKNWFVDETYIRVGGRWWGYLYRGIDEDRESSRCEIKRETRHGNS